MKPTSTHRLLGPLCASVLLAACQAPAALPPVTATLNPGIAAAEAGAALTVRARWIAPAACRSLAAVDSENWRFGNLSYLEFQLFNEAQTGGDLSTPEKTVKVAADGGAEGGSLTFQNLKPNTTYRVEARAYFDKGYPTTNDAPVLVSKTTPDGPWISRINVGTNLNTPLNASLILDFKPNIFDGKTNLAGIVPTDANGRCSAELIGTVSTVVGTGTETSAGAAGKTAQLGLISDLVVDPSDGAIYAALYYNDCVVKISPTDRTYTVVAGQYDSPGYVTNVSAAASRLRAPSGLALVGTTLYISEHGNDRVISVPLGGGTVVVVAGPDDATINTAGDNDASGMFNGTGKTDTRFNDPSGLAKLAAGLFVVDQGNGLIRHVVGDVTTVIAGDQAEGSLADAANATTVSLGTPIDIVGVGETDLYFTDREHYAVRRLFPEGNPPTGNYSIETVIQTTDDADASDEITGPSGITVDPQGRLWFGDADGSSISAAVRMIPKAAVEVPGDFLGTSGFIKTWLQGKDVMPYRDGSAPHAKFDGGSAERLVPVASDKLGRIYFGDENAQSLRLLQ